jgi:photosystem II stability/assembly factor-like uncharacterized protein
MNKIFSFLFVLCSLFSCSKNKDIIPEQPTTNLILPDTLSIGWTKINSLPNALFNDIFFIDNNIGYACNNSGIYKSVNGGLDWQKISNIPAYNIGAWGTKASFVFGTNRISTTLNTGTSFLEKDYTALPSNPTFIDCFYVNANTCFASSGKLIWKSIDSGVTFDSLYNFQTSTYNSLYFLNEQLGWIRRPGEIFKTTNSGISWVLQNYTAPGYGGLEFADEFNGYYVDQDNNGNLKVYKTINGGLTSQLSFQTTNVFGITDVDVINTNICYVSVDNKIFRTLNGGVNWNTIAALGNQKFFEIHFTDANHGWACTTDGTVLRFLQ